MMKRILLFAVALAATMAAGAQPAAGTWSVRPMAGMTVSNLVGKDSKGCDPKVGMALGAEAGYQLCPTFALSLGAVYMQQGCSQSVYLTNYDKVNGKVKINYLNLPLLANVYVVKGLALKAGLQMGILLTADAEVDVNGSSFSMGGKDAFTDIDMNVPVGLSYEYRNLVLDARYNIGVTTIGRQDYKVAGVSVHDEENHVRNSTFLFTIGYRFDL